MANGEVTDEAKIPSVPLRVYYRKRLRNVENNIPQEIIIKNEANAPSVPRRVYYRKLTRISGYNIPEELVLEILKRVPVVSLLRFMCVSKCWYSLITSPAFVSSQRSSQLSNQSGKHSIFTLFRIASRFFMHRLHEPIDDWTEIFPPTDRVCVVVGYCHGVVCLFDYFSKVSGPLILWNPSIRKALALSLLGPDFTQGQFTGANSLLPSFTLGFGFDLVSNDYKVVRVCYDWVEELNTTYLQAEICSLSKSGWTKVVTSIEGGKFILECHGVYVNGIIHWICMRKDEVKVISKSILSFNLATEVLGEIDLPLSVVPQSVGVLMSVEVVEDKLAVSCKDSGGNVLEHNYNDSGSNLWVMMEYGNPKSWRRLIDIYLGDSVGMIRGALITRDGKTRVATSAGNWISWDCNHDKIENVTLPKLEPDSMNIYIPSLVLFRCNNRDLHSMELALKKRKRWKRRDPELKARQYRSLLRQLMLRREGYLS